MHLKRLEVQGYKSFANKIEFIFDEGITAVVGPNGSGKSNVADAIRWVLGEQSYSNLRGKKTEDMIFSGSDGRARLGMASALLVLDNTDKWLPLDFSEVTISRRAYRSGENEYYLNGSRVRLRDVTELLAKGGLRRQTYTVIGQGMVDRVLSLHMDERRQLFEEAAGITFHRHKRATALSKLESTQANLLRLNDIVKEIEPRLKRLEKQAERAEEYSLVKSHLDGLLRVWYGYRWRQAQIELRAATDRLHEGEGLLERQRSQLHALTQEVNALRTEHTETRASLSLWYSENNLLNKQAEVIQRELAVNEERARQYAAQRQEIIAELQPLTTNLDGQRERVRETQESQQQISQELEQAELTLGHIQERLDTYQTQQQEIVIRRNTAAEKVQHLNSRLSQSQARLAQLEERQAVLQVERDSQLAEVDRLLEQQQGLDEKQAQLTAKLTAIEGELLGLETQQNQQRDSLGHLNQTAEEYKTQLAEQDRKEDALRARLDVLDKLRSDMAGYFAGVRAVLKPEVGLSGVIGPVSQLIRAPRDLEMALEAALGSRLQDVVVETFAAAEAAIAHLKRTGQGRATFLPLDTIRPGRAADLPRLAGVVGLASELVQFEEALRPVVDLILNRTVVVENLSAARPVFEALKGGFQIVTRDGELIRSGGSVTGGRTSNRKGDGSTFLAREREWQALPEQIEAVVGKQQALSTQLAEIHEAAAVKGKELQTLTNQYQTKDRQRREIEAGSNQVGRSSEQIAANIEWQQKLLTKIEAELEQIERGRLETRQEVVQLEQAHQEAEQITHQLAQEAGSLSTESLAEEERRARSEVTTLRARQSNRQAMLESYQSTQQQLAALIESKKARSEALAAEREALFERQHSLQERNGQFEIEVTKLADKIKAGEKKLAELEARQLQLEHDENGLRHRLQRLELDHNRASLEAARCQDELDNLQRHIHDDLGLVQLEMSEEQVGQPLLPIRPIVTDLPPVEKLPPGVEEDVHRLKLQLRRLGNINLDAPHEFAELGERHAFLVGQINDLEAAVADLREVIAKLDAAMEEAFTMTFQKVATEFQRYFKTLFGGGEAQLLLTNPHDLIETGVDIVARPPGKRLQSLALLSGGERALTAQALIFALLKISPTPFVIFDEVDAMLDEANVGRFREALVKLSHEIQFIIITHNRKTIESASTLYGVSMGDDSVSQVYSLKIDDWLGDRAKSVQ